MRTMVFSPLVLITLLINTSFGQHPDISYLSPGVKLGYVFGEGGGFTYGLEISFVQMVRPSGNKGLGVSLGPVLDVDFFKGVTRIHLGFEGAYVVGLCVGPTLVLKDSKRYWGYSIIPFFGALIYPYYSFTSTDEFTLHEVGSYLKIHIRTGGGYIDPL